MGRLIKSEVEAHPEEKVQKRWLWSIVGGIEQIGKK